MIFAYVAHRLLALIGQKYCLRSLALVEVASAPTGPAACPDWEIDPSGHMAAFLDPLRHLFSI